MGLRIVYGKPGSGKTKFCFTEVAKLIHTEKKIYIITPEQFSFTAEKNLMEAIPQKAVFNAEVITLSRMAYRVMNQVGGATKTNLSKAGKAMLVASILEKNKKDLKFLGKSDENIELGIQAITEFKKHGVKIEHLKEETSKIEDTYLKTKLTDLGILYEEFENHIQNHYIEETDLLTILAKQLEETDFAKDSIIYLDEFAGFTMQEYQVITKLIKQAKQVTITMTLDNLETNTNPDIDVFYSNKVTLSKLLQFVKKNDLKLEKPIALEKIYRFKTPELKHLSQNLYYPKSTAYEKNVENIHLFLAKNPYTEVENIAKQISNLVKKQPIRYRDIAIITKDIETYGTLIRSIFASYQIPVFIDEKRELNQNSIIQYFLAILEILVKNFSNESIFHYLKLGFHDIDKDEIFALENYTIKWGITQNKWKVDFYQEIEENKEKVERWNTLRKQIIMPLINLKEAIGKEKNATQISKEIYSFLQEQGIEENIKEKIYELQEAGKIDLANEYKESYQVLINMLDEMVLIFGEEKMTYDTYAKMIKIGLKNSGLGKIPGTQDQVIVGDIERSRSHCVKTVFIIGLNDGSFPSIHKEEGFLNDKDREVLKQDGIELAKGTLENLYEENFNIDKAFTTAENSIYLSYSSADGEGKSLRPSILISKIKKMFPKLQEESDVIHKQYQIMNEEITYQELLENIAKLEKKEKIEEIWFSLYQYYQTQEKWKQRLEQDLEGIKDTNLPQKIEKEKIDKLYGNTLNTSISKLERYRSCPFSYYLQYGLRIQEKQELKIRNLDTGSFMHETIDAFFEQVHEEDLALAELEEEQIQKMVSDIIDQNIVLQKNAIFRATVKGKILIKRLKKMVSKALKYIIETLIHSDFQIQGTELEFGKKGDYEPIVLTLENGKKIEITGKIDRIDTATKEDGKYVRIIDYKSSSKNIDLNEVYAGLQIQLLTYLDAVCKKEDFIPAGIFYFSLVEQMIKADKRISQEEIEELIRKNFKMKGLIVADVKIIKMNDNTLTQGSSKMVPATITASGTVNEKWTNGVKKEEFEVLQQYIDKTIKEIGKEILSGKIDIKPYYKKGKTPCEYCAYKTICGFHPQREGNCYYYIDNKPKDEILLRMKKEMNKG